jgi:radical SAM protein with 4Fe4S-binding SPASM domain
MNDSSTQSRYVDPHVELKEADVKGSLVLHQGYPVFGLIEFNIWGACNRRCEFCPISDPSVFTNIKEGITIPNYKKVLLDLRAIDYSGVILWSMFSEPTLHKDINELARVTKTILPNTKLQLTSNGDFFARHEDKLCELFEFGVDRINFSLYDGPHQLVAFTKMRKRCGLSTDQIKLRRRYREGRNYGITISNRAGLVDSNKYRDKEETPITALPLDKSCYYPFYQVAIDYNGDVLLCPHDWSKEYVTGNAFKESIWDIWRGPAFKTARNILANEKRSFDPCKKCDVAGNLIGQDNFDALKDI